MFLGEALDFSVKALKANPVRSFLTGLGMVIGTASVILVVTISLTSRDYILEQIEGVGSNMIFAYYEVGQPERHAGRRRLRQDGRCGCGARAAGGPHRRRHRRHRPTTTAC